MFIVQCIDKPGHGALRAENRPAHLDFIKARLDKVVLAGPTLGEDGQTMTGSVLVLDLPDRAAVEAFLAEDPYARAGLFETVTIQPFKKVFP